MNNEVNILSILWKHKGVFIGVLGLWVFFSFGAIFLSSDLSFSIMPDMSLGNMGTFGDSFNVLTSLFTGLAFAGVIVSVILQTTELRDARIEFRRQAEALELQQVDNKFFQMLDELNNLVGRLKYGKSDTSLECFSPLADRASENFIRKEEFIEKFKDFNNDYELNFKYYFINLYQVIKYINNNIKVSDDYKSDLDYDEKVKKVEVQEKEYINIVRAQQTKHQLKLLFFNCIGVIPFSGEKYKKLAEKYALFEHIRYADLVTIYDEKEDGECDNFEALEKRYFFVENFADKGNKRLIDSLLIQYEVKAFGKNEDMIKIWKNRKKLLINRSGIGGL